MPKPAIEDFFSKYFDTIANFPGSWASSADDLLLAADVLEGCTGDIFDVKREHPSDIKYIGIPKIQAMLRAMAIECLLKALLLKFGDKLANNGRYQSPLKKEHQLHKLAEIISKKGLITFTNRELLLLEQASYWITSGRYPIQIKFNYLVPYKRTDGTLACKQFFPGNPFREIKRLTKKLQSALFRKGKPPS